MAMDMCKFPKNLITVFVSVLRGTRRFDQLFIEFSLVG